MKSHPLIVPLIRYTNRPALRLLLGCVLGIIIFELNCLLVGTIILGITAIISLLLSKRIPAIELLMWLSIVGILFAGYLRLSSSGINRISQGQTLRDAHFIVHYPISSSIESITRYHASVELPQGTWVKVQLSCMPATSLYCGCEGTGTLDLSPLSNIRDESYRRYLMSEGYEAIANVQTIQSCIPGKSFSISSRLQAFRERLVSRFDEVSSNVIGCRSRGLIYALSLGDKSMLPRATKSEFAASGVAHILAVSGYHLGVVYGIVTLLIGSLLWRYKHRYVRYAIILLCLILYTLLTGASTATLRALVMVGIIILGKVIERPTDPIQLLSLVLLIFLVVNPFAYYSVGLLLSVSAVWGIYTFYPLFRRILSPHSMVLKWIGDIISVSLSAQIGVFPLLLMFFSTASLGFLWSNIPIIFLSGLLIPLSLIAFSILLVFNGDPTIILKVIDALAISMQRVAEFFSPEQYGINLYLKFDVIAVVMYYAIAYLSYRLLHSYVNRIEEHRVYGIKRGGAPY